MAKTFLCRRSPTGMAVMTGAIDRVHIDVQEAEKQFGQESLEVAEPLLILACANYALEDYKKAEDMFVRYIAIVKAKLGPQTLEVFHSLATLAHVYFQLSRLPEAFDLNNEAKSISKTLDPCAYDPMLKALVRRAEGYEGKTDLRSRQRRFVSALLALSWCISHGGHRGSGGAKILDGLREIFASHGLDEKDWEWTLKHAHLTKYDFLGLLSILLRHTGLAPRPSPPVRQRGLRIIEVR